MLRLNKWIQNNYSKVLGTLTETFNIDFEANRGRVRTMRAKRIATGDGGASAFGAVAALVYFSNALRVFAGSPGADNLWDGGNSPFDALTNDSTSTTATFDDGDAVTFNTEIYATEGGSLNRYNGTNENVVSTGLTDNKLHLMATFNPDSAERLYITEDDDKVYSVSQANALATSGSYTIDLSLGTDFRTTVLMAGKDRIWIGVSCAGNNASGARAMMYEWDGVTANTYSQKYYIDAARIMAGVMKDDTPHIVDSLGRILVFNGGGFVPLKDLNGVAAGFPLKGKTFYNTSTNFHQNAIHPRGMAVDGDEILICATNLQDGSSGATVFFNDFPSGVYAWNERNGLYHKLAPSYQAVADDGVTNLTDYGQFRAVFGGPIKVVETQDPVAADGGRIVFAMSYFLGAGDNISTDIRYGLWTDDTHDDTQKAGYLVTAQFPGAFYKDNWNELYAALTELTTTGDLVEIKYRMKDETPTYVTAEWTGTDRFNTDTELSSYDDGDEVQIIQGTGAGACAHAKTITSGAGSEVVLERNITGVTGSSKVRIEKWKKVAKIEDLSPDQMTIGEKGDFIQFKVYLQWTGAREFYELIAINKPSITI